MAYDVDLFCMLYEIFPGCFEASKTIETYEYKNGAFGQEKVRTGTEEVTLASQILDTAKAIALGGNDMERAFRYLEFFRKPKDQQKIIRMFHGK